MKSLAECALAASVLLLGSVPADSACRDIGESTFHCDPLPWAPSFKAPRKTQPYTYERKVRVLPGGTRTYEFKDSTGRRHTGTIRTSPYGRTWQKGTVR